MASELTLRIAAEVAAAHRPSEGTTPAPCVVCGSPWPCNLARLAFGMAELHGDARLLLAEHDRLEREARESAALIANVGETLQALKRLHRAVGQPARCTTCAGYGREAECWPCDSARLLYTEEEIATFLGPTAPSDPTPGDPEGPERFIPNLDDTEYDDDQT